MKKTILLPLLAFLAVMVPPVRAEFETISCGWYHWDPYQYLDEDRNLTGLDVALLKAIFAESEVLVIYDADAQDDWKKNQADVLSGEKHIVAGAFDTPERREVYHLSKPYRYEWNALYLRTEMLEQLQTGAIDELIQMIRQKQLRLGVIGGYKYTSDALNAYIKEERDAAGARVVESRTEERSFEKLANGKVDLVVSDRLVGARIIWQKKLGNLVSEHPIKLPEKPIHVLFHKSDDPVVEEETMRRLDLFNSNVEKLTRSGDVNNIIGHYLFPVLMNITVQRSWFHMIDILGATFFALTGLLIARDQKYDIFGTLVMVTLLAAGGGAMRDLIVGRPLALLNNTYYFHIILTFGILGFLICGLNNYLTYNCRNYEVMSASNQKKWMFLREVVEAVALGAYTIVGVGVAVEMKLHPLWLWGPILGCLTSCGGGIVANSLRHGEEIVAMRGAVAPECSLIWGAFLSQFLIWQTNRLNPREVLVGVVVTMAGTAITILIAGKFKINSPCLNYAKAGHGASIPPPSTDDSPNDKEE